MATYKVIQDIEAEDKLIGPFGFRQFVYLIIVAISFFIGFRLALVAWYLAIPLLPHTAFFALLALPFGGEQATETWLLAKIRFAIKPRIRVWNQSGIQELVTITAPKKIEKIMSDNMTEGEVRSRLEALANTIDSRGWVIKNVNVNVFSQPAFAGIDSGSDRLIDVDTSQQPIADPATVNDDILDEQNNPTAQNLNRMIDESSKTHRANIIEKMKHPQSQNPSLPAPVTPASPAAQPAPAPAPAPPNPIPTAPTPQTSQAAAPPVANRPDQWFMSAGAGANLQPAMPLPNAQSANIVTPDPNATQNQPQGMPLAPLAPASGPLSEEELLDKIHADKEKSPKNYGNMRVIKTLEEQQAEAKAAAAAPEPPVTPAPDPDIIELANNDDLNVATIARQAKKKPKDDGEVVINLH